MADARYVGSFFTSYTDTRMKLHRHCVPLANDPEKIAKIYGYELDEVLRIFDDLDKDLARAVDVIVQKYGKRLDEKFADRKESLVFIGDQLTSEYLSYFNIIKNVMQKYDGVSVAISGNTGDTSNQAVQYLYNLAISQEPTVTSILIGTNDLFMARDKYHMTVSSREEYAHNVDYLVKVLLHNGGKVILHTLPPVNTEDAESFYSGLNWTVSQDEVDARNALLREIAKKNKCTINDLAKGYENFQQEITIDGNGVLLTKEAQLFIAEKYIETLLSI